MCTHIVHFTLANISETHIPWQSLRFFVKLKLISLTTIEDTRTQRKARKNKNEMEKASFDSIIIPGVRETAEL